MKIIDNVQEIREFSVAKERKFFSATHEEIAQGITTDVYFVKTKETLAHLGLGQQSVVAEVFGRKDGILAGVDEVTQLLKGTGIEMWSLPEGAEFKNKEVIMRIIGPYDAFGIYETTLLGMLASSTGWATRAREVKIAADGRPAICFGARHVHPAVAPVMERAAIIGGADGASCILGAKLAGLEPMGTVPHALFLLVGDTVKAAQAYDEVMPPESPRSMLVDTFKDEVEESLRLGDAMGKHLESVRLDTPSERGGVTPGLVTEVRAKLDLAGYEHVQIFVSGGLDPERIRLLAAAGADAFGVGSYISAAPPIDMTMDIKEIDGKPVAKRGRIPGVTKTDRLTRMI